MSDNELIPLDDAEEEEEIIPLDQAEEVAPTVGVEAQPQEPRTMAGFGEAVLRGAGDMASLGWSDEAIAKLKSLYQDKPLADLQTQEQKNLSESKARYPVGFGTGQVGTAAVAGALAPELLVGSLPAEIAAAGTAGATYGLGSAKPGDNPLMEAGKGALEGEAGLVGGKAIVGGAKLMGSAISGLGKQAMSAWGGLKSKVMNEYIKNPALIETARDHSAIANSIHETIDTLQDRVSASAHAAVDLLPKGELVPADPFLNTIHNEVSKFRSGNTPEYQRMATQLEEYADRMFQKAKENGGQIGFDPMDVKNALRELDRLNKAYKRSALSAGAYDDVVSNAYKDIRQSMDQTLKAISPEYRAAQAGVAEDASLLSDVSRAFGGNPDALSKRLNSISTNQRFNQDARGLLRQLDEKMGTNLLDESDAAVIKNAFSEAERSRGSARTNIGIAGGSSVGGIVDTQTGTFPIFTGLGGMAGGLLGRRADQYGTQDIKALINAYLTAKNSPVMAPIRGMGQIVGGLGTGLGGGMAGAAMAPNIEEPSAQAKEFTLPESLKNSPYMQMIEKSKTRGQSAVGATHFMLMKNDPDYRKKYLGVDERQ